jgi:hypothetical protein
MKIRLGRANHEEHEGHEASRIFMLFMIFMVVLIARAPAWIPSESTTPDRATARRSPRR